VRQNIVAAGAQNEVGGVGRKASELRWNIGDCRSVDSEESCRPAGWKHRPHLSHDVRPAANVCGVVEDRITKKHYVAHSRP